MSNNKQSSIEWLAQQILHLDWQFLTQEKKRNICKHAKEMHRTEIIESYVSGGNDRLKNTINTNYYTETFGGNNEQE